MPTASPATVRMMPDPEPDVPPEPPPPPAQAATVITAAAAVHLNTQCVLLFMARVPPYSSDRVGRRIIRCARCWRAWRRKSTCRLTRSAVVGPEQPAARPVTVAQLEYRWCLSPAFGHGE